MIHGTVDINGNEIAEWQAEFLYDCEGPYRRIYNVTVTHRNIVGYPMVAEFLHVHEDGLGPLVLAGNIMVECVQHLRQRPLGD